MAGAAQYQRWLLAFAMMISCLPLAASSVEGTVVAVDWDRERRAADVILVAKVLRLTDETVNGAAWVQTSVEVHEVLKGQPVGSVETVWVKKFWQGNPEEYPGSWRSSPDIELYWAWKRARDVVLYLHHDTHIQGWVRGQYIGQGNLEKFR